MQAPSQLNKLRTSSNLERASEEAPTLEIGRTLLQLYRMLCEEPAAQSASVRDESSRQCTG